MRKKIKAVTTLLFTFVILMGSLMMTASSMKTAQYSQKIQNNTYLEEVALEASIAGIEYGLPYLKANQSTILVDNNNDGYIDSNSHVVSLDSNTSVTISFSNPIANDYNSIRITSVGSTQGNVTETSSRIVVLVDSNFSPPDYSVVVRGGVDMSSNSSIQNTDTDVNVLTGDEVDISNNAETITSSGVSSDSTTQGSDITADSSLQSLSDAEFFAMFFNDTLSSVESTADQSYASGGDYGDTLNGVQDQTIWIGGTGSTYVDASLSSNNTIGTESNPVVLIVNGNLTIDSNTTVHGIVFVMGDLEVSSNASITGSIIVGGDTNLRSNSDLYYSTAVIEAATNGMKQYSFAQSGWNDLGH